MRELGLWVLFCFAFLVMGFCQSFCCFGILITLFNWFMFVIVFFVCDLVLMFKFEFVFGFGLCLMFLCLMFKSVIVFLCVLVKK